ncbi:hypothetical protein T11_12407 [Trichinella zimbabwensis]|uniref:Uncharacterized protein n=1 Tax=Trichinella zimbabwensis TaxID=268475 RepID=A0A0V1HM30_9BILA|nr:hypothetical protein T11_12407 [Trichinella zimbabwensis]
MRFHRAPVSSASQGHSSEDHVVTIALDSTSFVKQWQELALISSRQQSHDKKSLGAAEPDDREQRDPMPRMGDTGHWREKAAATYSPSEHPGDPESYPQPPERSPSGPGKSASAPQQPEDVEQSDNFRSFKLADTFIQCLFRNSKCSASSTRNESSGNSSHQEPLDAVVIGKDSFGPSRMRYGRPFEELFSDMTSFTLFCVKSKRASTIDHWCSWVMTSPVKQH